MLAPEYANELHAHDALGFGSAIVQKFHANIHGFTLSNVYIPWY